METWRKTFKVKNITCGCCGRGSLAAKPSRYLRKNNKMKFEYKIKFEMPKGYDPYNVLRKLPSPISPKMTEIYNYSVQSYGFYFLDNRVDQRTAGHAMKLLVDECFKYSKTVKIEKL